MGPLGNDYIMNAEPSWMGLVLLKRNPMELPGPYIKWGYSEKVEPRKQPSLEHAGALALTARFQKYKK